MPEQVEETIVDIEKIAQSGQRPTATRAEQRQGGAEKTG